jgi:hypothetical protein
MRKEVFAGVTLAFIGLGVATPAMAEDWRACVVGACLKNVCGDNDASVVVSMGTDVSDPAVGGEGGLKDALLKSLLQRNQPMSGQPLMNCTPSQPSQGAADQMSQNIFAQMSTSFSDVRLVSPNDLIYGYDSTPGSEDPRYNGGSTADSSSGSSNDAQAEAQAAAAQRERDEAAAAAERERQAAQREREQAAAAEAERQRAAEESRRQRELAEAEAQRQDASTATDARTCVSSPVLQSNATFEGNTAASVVNNCGAPVDVRICLMRDNGWNCGMTNGLAPNASWSWSSFHATGQVFMDARTSGSGRTLNSP